MTRINVLRVIIGGIAAGIVINGIDFVSNQYLLRDAWERVVQGHNIDLAIMGGTASFVTYIVADVAIGLLIAFVYAAIRPRFGPGGATAILSGTLIWLAMALVTATFGGWFIPWDLYIK